MGLLSLLPAISNFNNHLIKSMKQLSLILCLVSISLCSIGQTPVKNTRCTAYIGNQQCSETVSGINIPQFDNSQVYCWIHSIKFIMWYNCIQESQYSDIELAKCDSLYGNKFFDLRKSTFVIKNGIVYAYDGYD